MNIRTKITAVAVAVVLAVTAILITAGYRSQSAAEARYVNEVLSGKRQLWAQIAGRLQEQMASHAKALTRDSVALKAIRKGDLAVVREQAATTHNMLSGDGTLERLQIFDVDGKYMAAFPEPLSGVTAKTLVHKVIGDSKVAFGINRDDDGSLQTIAAFPLYVRGKLRAVAVYSQGLQALLDSFQAGDGSDVFVLGQDARQEHVGTDNHIDSTSIPESLTAAVGMEVVKQDSTYRVYVAVPVVDEQGNTVATLVTSQDQTATYSVQAASTYTSIALVVLVLVCSAFGLFWYFRRVFQPIDNAIHCMTEIAGGHLDCALPAVTRDDETGRLNAGLNDMVEQLRTLIGEISDVTGRLVTSTGHLSAIADQSNERIATQRAETGQVATAINEMAATVREVAVSAANAATAASHASERTRDGQAIVENTISSIEGLVNDVDQARQVISKLRSESEHIGSVLDVIRGIAEQTNLLALNAAIEAARAGEQGRGFAVVADEVRTLASRTQQSTQDIQHMIETLQQGAENAVSVMKHSHESSERTREHASSAHRALEEITQSVTKIDEMNTQIAGAAEEQSTVSEMISRSVVEIAGLAEESLRATEQTAHAATQLSDTGSRLGGLVKRFEL